MEKFLIESPEAELALAASLQNFAGVTETTAHSVIAIYKQYLARFNPESPKQPTLTGLFRKLQRELDAGNLNITLEALMQTGIVLLFSYIAGLKQNPNFATKLDELSTGIADMREEWRALPIHTNIRRLRSKQLPEDLTRERFDEAYSEVSLKQEEFANRVQLLSAILGISSAHPPKTIKTFERQANDPKRQADSKIDYVYASNMIGTRYYIDLLHELTNSAVAREGELNSELLFTVRNYLIVKLANQSYREVFSHLTFWLRQADRAAQGKPDAIPTDPLHLLSIIFEGKLGEGIEYVPANLHDKLLAEQYQGSLYALSYGQKIRNELTYDINMAVNNPVLQEVCAEMWSIVALAHNRQDIAIFQTDALSTPLRKVMSLLTQIQLTTKGQLTPAARISKQNELLLEAVDVFTRFFYQVRETPKYAKIFNKSAARRIQSFLTRFEEVITPQLLEGITAESVDNEESAAKTSQSILPEVKYSLLPRSSKEYAKWEESIITIEQWARKYFDLLEDYLPMFYEDPRKILQANRLHYFGLTLQTLPLILPENLLDNGFYTLNDQGNLVAANITAYLAQAKEIVEILPWRPHLDECVIAMRLPDGTLQEVKHSRAPQRAQALWGPGEGVRSRLAYVTRRNEQAIASGKKREHIPPEQTLPGGILIPETPRRSHRYALLVAPKRWQTVRRYYAPIEFIPETQSQKATIIVQPLMQVDIASIMMAMDFGEYNFVSRKVHPAMSSTVFRHDVANRLAAPYLKTPDNMPLVNIIPNSVSDLILAPNRPHRQIAEEINAGTLADLRPYFARQFGFE
jgi:hypothetical protein